MVEIILVGFKNLKIIRTNETAAKHPTPFCHALLLDENF
jgi:hypothetical protein